MAERLIYEGPVYIYTTKPDKTPLTFVNKEGVTVPFAKAAFTVNGQKLYLADWSNTIANIASGSVCKVAYEQEFTEPADAFSQPEPKLYQGQPQYRLIGIEPSGTAPAPQRANAAPPAAQSHATADDHKTTDIRRAVAVKAATEVNAALIGQGVIAEPLTFDVIGKVLTDAGRIVKWLETGEEPNEFDAMMDAAKSLTDDPDADIPFG